MKDENYTPLQAREVFHLEFLRWLCRKLPAEHYALKGGVNLRLFFKSFRYSEDMDIDIQIAGVEKIIKLVMDILSSRSFCEGLKSYGIGRIAGPDITKAKQTQTTQRFKVHLITSTGEDLFTKVEFSRRGIKAGSIVGTVSTHVLRAYKMPPLLVSHYGIGSAVEQKIQALAQRSVVQARDIFDLYLLSSQFEKPQGRPLLINPKILKTALDNLFLIEYPQFRDSVVAYLADEDQSTYAHTSIWDEIQLKTAHFLEEFQHEQD